MSATGVLILWFALGVASAVIMTREIIKKYQEIKIGDVPFVLVAITLGPILIMVELLDILINAWGKTKNKSLWKSKDKIIDDYVKETADK